MKGSNSGPKLSLRLSLQNGSPIRNDIQNDISNKSVNGDSCKTLNRQGDGSPRIVTEEKLKCYDKFKGIPLILEGPEFNQDYSYFLYVFT